MPSFRDVKDREWIVAIDAPLIEEIRREEKIDLIREDAKDVVALSHDLCKLVNVLWLICRRNSLASGMSPSDFAAAIYGDCFSTAADALVQAVASFFPKAERTTFLKAYEVIEGTRTQMLGKALARISDKTLPERLMQEQERRLESKINEMLISSPSVTPLPASLE